MLTHAHTLDSELNLSFNRLDSVAHINEVVGSVKSLNLKNNLLESAEGLEKLYALETLVPFIIESKVDHY